MTGMRLGEVMALEWSWIDFASSSLRLPDAKAGARSVALGGPALSYLAGLDRVGPFVCFDLDPAKPIGKGPVRRFWTAIRKRAQLVNARPHDLRHTYGTYTAATGANAFIVRDMLGHKTMAMTARYVERDVNPLRKAADAVASRISAAMAGGAGAEVVPLKPVPKIA